MNTAGDPFSTQIGGDHYKDMAIQPAVYALKNQLSWAEGTVVKYVSRWRKKGGLTDLKKARHVLDMLIAEEEQLGTHVTGGAQKAADQYRASLQQLQEPRTMLLHGGPMTLPSSSGPKPPLTETDFSREAQAPCDVS